MLVSEVQQCESAVSILLMKLLLELVIPLHSIFWSSHYSLAIFRNQDSALSLHSCFLTIFPLFLHSLTSLIRNVWIYPLEPTDSQGARSLFSCKQGTGITGRFFYYPGAPHRALLIFEPYSLPPLTPHCSKILLNLEWKRRETRKRIKLWKEKLIINSAEKLSFRHWNRFGLPVAQQVKMLRHQRLPQRAETERASKLRPWGQGAGVL